MPTLCFADHFSPIDRRILTRTFRQNCKDLGICHRDASIDITRVYIPNPSALGAITKLPDRFKMILNDKNDLLRSIFAVGHEMVHFDQHTRGDMVDDNYRHVTYWKGKPYPAWMNESKEHYPHLPWEIEAAARQDALMDSAMKCLPRDERRHVLRPASAMAA